MSSAWSAEGSAGNLPEWQSLSLQVALGKTPQRPEVGTSLAAEEQVRYGIRIGPIGLLLQVRAICEVVAAPSAARLPRTPPWLKGVTNLRGALIPVFDLHQLFGVEREGQASAASGLVFDRGELAAAVITDGVPRALRGLQVLDEVPPVAQLLRPHVSAAFQRERELWLQFDHAGFFAAVAGQLNG